MLQTRNKELLIFSCYSLIIITYFIIEEIDNNIEIVAWRNLSKDEVESVRMPRMSACPPRYYL